MDSKAFRRPQNGNVPLFLFFFSSSLPVHVVLRPVWRMH